MCENLDDEILHSIEKKIIQNHPNTYTFTKNLAEQVVFSDAKDLPIAIVRPSIVTAAMKQPYPGWINGFFGITGILIYFYNISNQKKLLLRKELINDKMRLK